MTLRTPVLALALATSLFSGGAAVAEDEIEPDPATTWGQNDGETGYQTLTINVTLPGPTRSAHDDVLMKIAGDCEFTTVGKPNTNQTYLVAVAHASSSNHSVHGLPVSTGVTCRVKNSKGGIDIEAAAPLTNIAAADTAEVTYGPFKLCIRVSVHYANDFFARSKEICRLPISPV